jgi:hypothetical protein
LPPSSLSASSCFYIIPCASIRTLLKLCIFLIWAHPRACGAGTGLCGAPLSLRPPRTAPLGQSCGGC